MNSKQKFEQDLQRADFYEKRIFNYLNSNYEGITDVRNDSEYMVRDIDFIFEHRPAELKVDFYDTGNFAFECTSHTGFNTEGCILKTEAEVLLYYFTKTLELFIFHEFRKFREWLLAQNFRKVKMGDNAEGFLVKKELINAHGFAPMHIVGEDWD